MDKATFLENMDKYIDGTLTGTEKYDFEQMLENDPVLQEEFGLHKSLRGGIKKSARLDFQTELNAIKAEVYSKPKKVIPLLSRWKIMGIAAAFIGIIVSLVLFRNIGDLGSQSEYIGSFAVKTLPKEGNLGSPNAQTYHVLFELGNNNEYEIKNDSLFLISTQKINESLKTNEAMITMNGQRDILINIKDKQYIFHPKVK
jgi:hypothetical protein